MRIDARLPLLVTGHPMRTKGPRDVLVSKIFQWDIPEVSLSDMPVAFETGHAFRRIEKGFTGPVQNYEMKRFRHPFVLRHSQGNLYRKAADTDADLASLFSFAFPTAHQSGFQPVDMSISLSPEKTHDDRGACPLSIPVYRQLKWHQNCRQVFSKNNELVWPVEIAHDRAGPWGGTPDSKRNHVIFEDVVSRLPSFDHDQYDACIEMYRHHMDGFLLADGELWVRTGPPVIKVERSFETQKTDILVSLSLFSPHDRSVPHSTFSIFEHEEAIDYANRMKEIENADKVGDGQVFDLTVDYNAPDASLLGFDHREEELRRLSCALAVESHRFIKRNTKWVARKRIPDDVVEGILLSFDEVMATNYVTGQMGDPSPWMESNAAFWKSAGRRSGHYMFGGPELADLVIRRGAAYAADRPISLWTFDGSSSSFKGV